jgi:hypothetical protein
VRRNVQDAQKLDPCRRVHEIACADLPALFFAAERCQASRQFVTMQPCMPALPFLRLAGLRTPIPALQNSFGRCPAEAADVTEKPPVTHRDGKTADGVQKV